MLKISTVLTLLVGLMLAGCGSCEYHDGEQRGTDICLLSDKGTIATTEAEFVTAIGLFDDELGTAPEERFPVYVTIVAESFDCGVAAAAGTCSGLYQSDIKFMRGALDECFARTAFIHEWAHRMMDDAGLRYWEHDIEGWFGKDGHVASVEMKYTLLYCMPAE